MMNTAPLTEVSRPRVLSEIIGQEDAVRKLTSYLDSPDDTPHLVLSGPPGCGKTSAILAWARDVYGTISLTGGGTSTSRPVKVMNMSAMRNVKDVLDRIHETCQYIHDTSKSRASRGLVVCDEADSLTAESQEVLVYCLRKYRPRWIFVLIMNYPSRIGSRLWAECEHIPFLPLSDIAPMVSRVVKDAHLNRRIPKKMVGTLMDAYDGDLRRILNAAQGVIHSGSGFVPEWKRWDDEEFKKKTPSGVYRYLRDRCESEGTIDGHKVYLELGLSVHRPGSLRPIVAAIQEWDDSRD